MLEEKNRIHDPEKLSFVFEGKALEELKEIAAREGMGLDEVIESALGLRKYALDVKRDGGTIIVRRKKGKDRELVF